jgi:tRNA1(Val) A37 N6-methylase TrmN6
MNTDDFTIDAFHFGRFHLVQPKNKGHRSGMDAMLLASLVAADGPVRVADLGAGAGAAGLAVVSRLPLAEVTLVERSAEMVAFARQTCALAQNAPFAPRLTVLQADVSLTGKARLAAGLADNAYDHVIMNPPFNDAGDRATPYALKAEAHLMTDNLFDIWIKTACAICKPSGQLSLIARPQSLGDIMTACNRRFGGLEITPIHPREGENAVRILVTGIKGSKSRLALRPPLIMHEQDSHRFRADVDDCCNGKRAYGRV